MSSTKVRFSEIIKVHYGKALKKDERNETGEWDVFGSSGAVGKHNETLTDAPTIIIGRKGSVGEVTYAPTGGWTIDQYVEPINGGVDLRYLFYALREAGLARHTITTSIPGINRDDIYGTKIPLPPLPEQKRIAGILDKADAIRRKRQQAIGLTEQFLRSTFLDMFGDPVTNPKKWPLGTLGDIVHAAQDGPHVSPKYADDGIPLLSTRHVKPEGVVWEDLKYISAEEAQRQWTKCKPARGDVLYTKGGTTGIATAIDFDEEVAVWVHCALLKTNRELADPYWLATMLNSAYCYTQSQRFTHGITNKDLGLKRMVKIKLYIPPLEEQQKYADAVCTGKQMRERLVDITDEHDNLFNSLVQRAFRGEL